MATLSLPSSSPCKRRTRGVKRLSNEAQSPAPKRPNTGQFTRAPANELASPAPPSSTTTAHVSYHPDDTSNATRDEEIMGLSQSLSNLSALLIRQAANLKKADKQIQELKAEQETYKDAWRKDRQDALLKAEISQQTHDKKLEQERLRVARIFGGRAHALQSQLDQSHIRYAELKTKTDTELKLVNDKLTNTSAELTLLRSKYHRALSESTFYQSAHDAAVANLNTASEDLKELQRVVHEDKMADERRRLDGLPPAYGSWDNNPLAKAPYGRHEDGGIADAALLKQFVRANFDNLHVKAQYVANEHRQCNVPNLQVSAGTQLFVASTKILYDTCISLMEFLEKSSDMEISSRSKQKGRVGEQATNDDSHPVLVATPVTELILECCNKLLAGIEMRFYDIHFGPDNKINIILNWRIIDDTMKAAVEIAVAAESETRRWEPGSGPLSCLLCNSPKCTGHCGRMFSMCMFKLQITDVFKRLCNLTPGYPEIEYFGDTLAWLTENIEIERRLAASAYLPPTRDPSPSEVTPSIPTLIDGDEPTAGPSSEYNAALMDMLANGETFNFDQFAFATTDSASLYARYGADVLQ